MSQVQVVCPIGHRIHHPVHMVAGGLTRPHPDVPARVDVIATELQRGGMASLVDAIPATAQEVSACHHPEYLDFLQRVCAWLADSDETSRVLGPSSFPSSRWSRRPRGLVGQAGFYSVDMETPLDRNTWEAAMWSAGAALTAARIAATKVSPAYAACRPPGHHAGRDWCGGFCYINNAAVAASFLASLGRVGLLDIDYHHGNGTQDIFYERPDILVISIHADPDFAYPYFCGYAEEKGRGRGQGFNHNIPLALGATSSEYLAALDEALDTLRDFAPEYLVVSLGTDTAAGDPIGKFALTTRDFAVIGRNISSLGTPILVIQEGGYNLDMLGVHVSAFIGGLCQQCS